MVAASKPSPLTSDLLAFLQELRLRTAAAEQAGSAPASGTVKTRGTLRFSNGAVYRGDILGGTQRHGQGDYTCENGEVYSGGWRLDKRHGRGSFTSTGGMKYEGEWRDDLAHGQGTCVYPDGSSYEGDWQSDKRHGWGSFRTVDGESHEGEWADDAMHGFGRWQFADGSWFEGTFERGHQRHGKLHHAATGLEYEGEFDEGGLRHGQGCATQPALWTYCGAWARGVRQGSGECRYADGAAYKGEWKDDVRSGQGTLTQPDGFKYSGAWEKDKPHGVGAAQWGADGEVNYRGEWFGGERHGQGRGTLPGAGRYVGEWAHGKPHGQGVCAFFNGDKYQGQWVHGKRHGRGVCVYADGTRFLGAWESDAWVQSAADPRTSRAAGKGLARAVAGQAAQFRIQARDEDNQPRLSGGDAFEVVVESQGGEVLSLGSVTDLGDGTYDASYLVTAAVQCRLHITNGEGEPVAESPYALRVHAGQPCVARCSIGGCGRRRAACGAAAEFWVQASDAHGNSCEGDTWPAALPVQARLTRGPQEVHVVCTPQAAGGRYTCSYVAPQPGLWVLEVTTAGGRHLRGSPSSVEVVEVTAAACVQPPAEAPLQEPAAGAAAASGAGTERVLDQRQRWEAAARAMFAAVDGDMTGFDSDQDGGDHRAGQGGLCGPEREYVQEHPEVPVVERMEDLWRLSKLLAERKARDAAASPVQGPPDDGGMAAGTMPVPGASASTARLDPSRRVRSEGVGREQRELKADVDLKALD